MNGTPEITELSGFTLVHAGTRANPADVAASLSVALGLEVSAEPGSVAHGRGGLRVLWFGPGRWLIHAAESDFTMAKIDGCMLTDLSDSRRVFRWSGEGAIRRLERSCPLDLRESSMPMGTAALTQFDRFSVLLYRVGTDEFDLYVDRSYGDTLPGATA